MLSDGVKQAAEIHHGMNYLSDNIMANTLTGNVSFLMFYGFLSIKFKYIFYFKNQNILESQFNTNTFFSILLYLS